jgi:P450-derived glycosyltransferase activator
MSITATDSELGRHLLTVRGFQFVMGALGDPYALLLMGETADPELMGRQVREGGPLYRSNMATWVTASAAPAAQLLQDSRLGTRHPGSAADQDHVFQNVWEAWQLCHVTPLDGAFLTQPGDDYQRLARMAAPVLGADVVGAWQVDIERVVDQVLDRLDGEFDLVADLARPIVINSLAQVLGLPDAARTELAELVPQLGIALDAILCPPQLRVARRLMDAVTRLRKLLGTVVTARLAEPRDDAVSALFATVGERDLAQDDVLAICVLAAVAGAEIATAVISNAVMALLEYQDQWKVLGEDPDRASDAIEETLRWAPPVRMQSRIAQQDFELAGQEIEEDSHVVVLVDAANRDPAATTDPDRFDLDRPHRTDYLNLALAGRTYESVVAPLARLQATVTLRGIARRMPALRVNGPVLRRIRSPVVRAVLRFPLTGH